MNNENIFNNPSAVSNLVKNPLGIIGLFILLVYGIASLLVGLGGKSIFNENQIWLIIVFLIGFPCIVLGVFYWLVTEHHQKLYAPKDYRDDETFAKTFIIQPATQTEIDLKDEAEVKDIALSEQISENCEVNITGVEAKAAIGSTKINVPTRHVYAQLEESAIEYISKKYGHKFDRNMKLGFEKNTMYFDGIYQDVKNSTVTIVEVKIARTPMIINSISTLLIKLLSFKKYLSNMNLEIILCLLIDEDKCSIKDRLYGLIEDIPLNIKVEFLNLSDFNQTELNE